MLKRGRSACGRIAGTLLLGLLLAGCSSDDAAQKNPDRTREGSAQPGQTNVAVPRAANLTVRLTPRAPTAATDLFALAGGNPSVPVYAWRVNDVPLREKGSNRLAAGNFGKDDRVSVSLSSEGTTVSDSITIGNSPPRIVSYDFVEPRLHAGVDIAVRAEARDVDGDTVSLRYSWTLNDEIVAGLEENILPGADLKKGDRISFTIVANDGESDGPPYQVGEFVIPNGAPHFVSTYPLQFSNFVYQYSARAEDPDNDPLRYELEAGPEGMSIDPQTGELSWEINTGQGGEYHVSIAAEDPEGLRATQEFTLTVTIP